MQEMDMVTRVQILYEAVYILKLFIPYTVGKGMNSTMCGIIR